MIVSHTRCEDSTWSSLSKEVVTSEEQERWASFLSLCVVALLSWSTAPFISLQYFQFYLRYFARLSYVVCAFHFWPKHWDTTMIDLEKWIRLSMIWSITYMFKDDQSNYFWRYHFLRVDHHLYWIQLYKKLGDFSGKGFRNKQVSEIEFFLILTKLRKNTSYPTGTYTWTDPIYLKRRLDLMLHHLPDTLRTNHEDWRRNVATNNKMIHHGTDPSSRQEVWWWQKELVRRGVSTTGCEISRGDL